MDLHLHTPASIDYKQSNVTYLDLLTKAEERNLDIIAFTDHNSVMGYARYLEEVESLALLERLGRLRDDERERLKEYRRLSEEILILPGFEFTATLGFHVLGIFPPETTVRELEHLLLLLRVPTDKLDQGSGEVGATSDVLTAYRMINEAGGLVIAAHANSSHGVAMPGFDFGGQTRISYTQDPNLHALEVTDLESKSRRRTAMFFNGTKPEYPRRMHCIQGSDAHKLIFDPRLKNEMGVGDRATEILIEDVTFEAIRKVLMGNDFVRARPSRLPTEEPFDPIREARELGDTLVQSFHERLHERRGIARKILEDVVALSNTNGGTIYVGASANPRTVVAGVDRPEQASAELRAAISKEIAPPLDIQVDVLKSQSKNVLQVIVPRGSEVPYALEGSHIYVRSENETTLAHRDEVVQLVRDALAVEFAAAMPSAGQTERHPGDAEAKPGEMAPQIATEASPSALEPPRTGVEIVSSEVRKGVTYYAVRDLRNGRIVQNVTRASARRLWQYAIEEQERGICEPDKISWSGNVGICRSNKRSGKTRYDLVQRVNGRLLVYYGVTEDGIHGPWRELVEGVPGAESEEPESEQEFLARDEVSGELQATASDQFAEFGASAEVEVEPSIPEPEAEAVEAHKSLLPMIIPETREERAPEAAPATEPMPQVSAQEPARDEVVSEYTATEPVASEGEVHEPGQPTDTELLSPPPPAKPPEQTAPKELPTVRKTRAQEWREILDRAIADARAAQQAAKTHPTPRGTTPSNHGEEAPQERNQQAEQSESGMTQVTHSEEQADKAQKGEDDTAQHQGE